MIKKIVFLLFMLSILGIQTIMISASSDYEHKAAMYRLHQIYYELDSHDAFIIQLQQMYDNGDISLRELNRLIGSHITFDEFDKISGIVVEQPSLIIDINQSELSAFIANVEPNADIASLHSVPSFLQDLPICRQGSMASHLRDLYAVWGGVLRVDIFGPLCVCGNSCLTIFDMYEYADYLQEVDMQGNIVNRNVYSFSIAPFPSPW